MEQNSADLAKKTNKRRNSEAIAKLKGISTKDVKQGSYIEMNMVKKFTKIADDASSEHHSEVSLQSDEEDNTSPLRRMKLKNKAKLKT